MSVFDILRGTKRQELIPVPGLSEPLPVTIIRGTDDGPNILITAGIHNEEYVGIETANRLALELAPEMIRGCVVIIHICNPTGFAAQSRDVVPEDGKNLNRCFPGSADSTGAHRLAHFITEDFIRPASCHIDLHSGGGREELVPHVYYQAMEEGPISDSSRKLAMLMDAPFMVASEVYNGSAFSHAMQCGVVSILMERGSMALWTEEEVEDYLIDVRRILYRLGVLPDCKKQRQEPRDIIGLDYYHSKAGGCWYPSKRSGSMVNKGECLGTVKDSFGNALCSVFADSDCAVLFQLGSFSVQQGEFVVACGRL